MIKIKPLALIISLIVISSCKKKDDPAPKNENNTGIDCIMIGSERFYNGNLIGRRSYIYNTKDLLTDEIGFNEFGAKTDTVHYTYDNKNNLLSSYVYNFSVGFSQGHEWSYFPDGKVKWDQLSFNGKITVTNTYFYNPNGYIDSIKSISNGTPVREIFYYQNDTLLSRVKSDETGSIIRLFTYKYNGNITTITTVDGQAQPIKSENIEYDGKGREIVYKQYNGDGTLSFTRNTDYDAKGNIVNVTEIYDQDVYNLETTWKCKS